MGRPYCLEVILASGVCSFLTLHGGKVICHPQRVICGSITSTLSPSVNDTIGGDAIACRQSCVDYHVSVILDADFYPIFGLNYDRGIAGGNFDIYLFQINAPCDRSGDSTPVKL